MKVTFNSHEYEIQDANPAANCLPWNLDQKDFSDFIESVRTNYDPEKPVIIQQSTGLVVSGRRRLLACKIADVLPETRTVDWDDEKIYDWVMSDELIRRNLTKGQRASALLKLAKLNGHGGNRKNQDLPGTLDSAKSQQQIANETY